LAGAARESWIIFSIVKPATLLVWLVAEARVALIPANPSSGFPWSKLSVSRLPFQNVAQVVVFCKTWSLLAHLVAHFFAPFSCAGRLAFSAGSSLLVMVLPAAAETFFHVLVGLFLVGCSSSRFWSPSSLSICFQLLEALFRLKLTRLV
jgi:hypothetical protein